MKRGVSVLQEERKMAEGPDPREKALEELEKEITCAVCHGFYQKAKLLPCNHYYCSTCIEKMAARSRGGPFDCPECRKETSLPAGGVAGLQPAFFVERIKDLHGKMARAEGKVEALCEQCAGGKSVAFCRQCAEFICDDCVQSHKKLKVFAGHVVASLEDLKKGGVKNIPLKESPAAACADHGEPKSLFCFDCERLICRDCTIIEHKEHKFVKKCAPEGRRRLRESLAPLQEVRADMAGAEKRVVSEEAKVERQREEVCGAVQQSFEQLKAVLERRKAELVGKVSSLAQEKKNALAAQKTVLQVAQKEIQLLMELVERNVESTSDQDLMSIRRQLQSKMEEEEEHHRQLSLEPTATADIACHLPSPDDIPKRLGSVFNKNTPHAFLDPVTSYKLGSPVQVTLCAPRVSLGDISAGLKCVADPSSSSLEGEVVENGVGVFSISVTPGVRGRHDLTVKVRGEEIEGSPFRVFVKFPLSELGQEDQTRMVGDFSEPWGIAVNNKQQLIVVESGYGGGRKITVMERDGRKVQTIECDQFQGPRGVAVASVGAVYVTDISAKCLFKLNSKGKLLKTVRNELQKPYSVKIIGNRVYVVDRASQLVKIFDVDCNVVGTIQTKECPKPGDIAQGPDGLYVAGERKISVYRCAPNGVFIRHLNLTPSSLKLSGFRDICIDTNGHIIVSVCIQS